jgi:hypothetical protein
MRSSSQLEETSASYQVSLIVALGHVEHCVIDRQGRDE